MQDRFKDIEMRIMLSIKGASKWQPVIKRIRPHDNIGLLKMQIKSFAARHGITKPVVQISSDILNHNVDIDDDTDLKLAVQTRVQKKSNMKMTFVASFGDDQDAEWGSSLAKRCFDPWIVVKVAFWSAAECPGSP